MTIIINPFRSIASLGLILAIISIVESTQAQTSHRQRDVRIDTSSTRLVILKAIRRGIPTRIEPPAAFLRKRMLQKGPFWTIQQSTISVSYSGFTSEAEVAFQYAVDIWSSLITSSVEIKIVATFTSLGAGVLGSAGPTSYAANFDGAPFSDTWYPIVLAEKLSSTNLNETNSELVANFNSDRTDWYFGIDANTPLGKYDFVTVVLHELCHGLGFIGSMTISDGQGSWGISDNPLIFDLFAANGSSQQLINTSTFENPSSELATQLQSGDIYFGGIYSQITNGGSNPKLYAPSTWESGSSFSHLDESTFLAGDTNSLMTPQLGDMEAIHQPGPITMAIFQDIGWTIESGLIFTDRYASLPNTYISSAKWGDYDNDGDLDILLVGGNETTGAGFSKIFRNDNSFFTDISASLTGLNWLHNGSIEWGDFDNDNDLDLLLTGSADNGLTGTTKIYRNDNGSFVDLNATLVGVMQGSASWGDFDNDGDLDILLTGHSSSSVPRVARIYRNDGGTFNDISASLDVVESSSAAWGDFDNDGDLDIVLVGATSNTLVSKIYRNDASSFVDISAGVVGVSSGSVAWGDFDSDGDLDLLLTGQTIGGDRIAKVYRNDSGSFNDISANLTGVYFSAGTWGDYDNDGDLDILLIGHTSISRVEFTRIYRNDSGTFVNNSAPLKPVYSGSVEWGDFDNDGDLDILLTGYEQSDFLSDFKNTKVFRNEFSTPNNNPSAPETLIASVSNNSVTLTWSKSTDSETPQNGLTYNLRIGTVPGGNDILSPMANVANGRLKSPRFGNAGHNNSRTIRNLSEGTYYWSIQAVDNGFAASSFAPEDSFEITTPIAVELSNFFAQTSESAVKLIWRTETEVNNYGFEIERRTISKQGTPWSKIAFVAGRGTASLPNQYSFTDTNLPANRYAYRIKQIDNDGTFIYYGNVEVEIFAPPMFSLAQNFPNPFNSSTRISFDLPLHSFVTLKIFDLLGREVVTIISQEMVPGRYSHQWEAKDLPSGMYLSHLQAGQLSQTKKLILLR